MDNREQIRSRMVKTAARLWGYPEDEPVSSFDPLVNLLFSSCALELEKLSGDIEASRARVLEKAVQLLAPESLSGPLPAHAILHARSVEKQSILKYTDQFYCTQKLNAAWEAGNHKMADIYFAPTAAFAVNDKVVKYLATGHQLFSYRHIIAKEIVAHATSGKTLPESTLWLGIEGQSSSWHNTQCYFDIRNEVNREKFYQHLPEARWYDGDKLIPCTPGYNMPNISGEYLDVQQLLNRDNNYSFKVCEHVNAYYQHQFITLTEETNKETAILEKQKVRLLPVELQSVFAAKDLQPLEQQNLHWIKIQFPENIASNILQDVLCHFNSFPVINRQLHELSHRINDIINIIPLYSADNYFDIQEIADQGGNYYPLRSITDERQPLSVLLRQGGVARFDERNAAAIVEHLLQLLSDESAAFAVLGRDFMAGEIRQLQQIIYKLEQQLQSKQLSREETPSLIVRPHTKQAISNLLISFWSTKGSGANFLKAGTSLQAYKTGDGYHHHDITLLSATVGGRDKLTPPEKIAAYRSALLSRDRLVSMEDIRRFCQVQLGQKASTVTVKKGTLVTTAVSQGFARTIDVHVGLTPRQYLDARDKDLLSFWQQDLVKQLTAKSAGLTPFRVFIQQVA